MILTQNPTTKFLFYTLYIFLFCSNFSLANAQITQHRNWDLDPVYTGVTVAIFTFLFILTYIIFYYCFHHFRNSALARLGQRAPQPEDPTRDGLDPAVLKTFPVFTYSEVWGLKLDTGPSECAVCLGPFEAGEKLRLLPTCDHVFHLDCVDHWLSGHSTCPLCRAKLDQQPVDSTRVNLARLDVDLNVVGNDVVERTREIQMEGQFGKFKRRNSTGHEAVVGVVDDDEERFTLRLTLDARNDYLAVNMNRSRSCNAALWSNL